MSKYVAIAVRGVVTKDIPFDILVPSASAKLIGWMCECGQVSD